MQRHLHVNNYLYNIKSNLQCKTLVTYEIAKYMFLGYYLECGQLRTRRHNYTKTLYIEDITNH